MMKTDEKSIISLLPRYFRNEVDSKEIEAVTEWVKANDQNRRIFDEIRDIWYALNSEEEKKNFDTEKAWKKYSKWIDAQQTEKKKLSVFRIVSGALKYASVIVVTLFVSYMLFHGNGKPAEAKPFIVEVPNGQTSTITLYDGTVVSLNSGSKLICDSYNSKTERRVSLDGEGYFKVTHDPDVPFFVDVKKMSIKVYGTEFNVYAYEDDNYFQTTLVQGKVGVILPNGTEYILKPSEMLKLEDGKVVKAKVDVNKNISWIKGYYAFKDAPLSDIARHLGRMFNVKVILDSPNLKDERYTGKINSGDHILDVMQKLRMTSTFVMGYDLNKDTVRIFRK